MDHLGLRIHHSKLAHPPRKELLLLYRYLYRIDISFS